MNDHFLVLIFTAVALLLLKLQNRFKYSHYFWYGRLLDGYDSDISLFGILYRTLIPAVCGIFVGAFSIYLGYNRTPEFYGCATGALTAFLVVWPSIYCPDQTNQILYSRLKMLYLMRAMFFALYVSLGHLGGNIAGLFAHLAIKFGHLQAPTWWDGKGIVTNLISAAFWTIGAYVIYLIHSKLQKLLQ